MVKYETLALATKYGLSDVYCAVSTTKQQVWWSYFTESSALSDCPCVFDCVIVPSYFCSYPPFMALNGL